MTSPYSTNRITESTEPCPGFRPALNSDNHHSLTFLSSGTVFVPFTPFITNQPELQRETELRRSRIASGADTAGVVTVTGEEPLNPGLVYKGSTSSESLIAMKL